MPALTAKILNFTQAIGPLIDVEYPLAASVAFKYLGGKFVTLDGNERAALTVAGDTRITGWALAAEFTSNATAGVDKITVNLSREAAYWMPASGAVTRDLVRKQCDIITSAAGLQQANIAASTTDVLTILDVDIANQYVLVQIYDTVAPAGVV